MKIYLLKAILAAVALVGLLLMIGDMPDATLGKFAATKAAGALILLVSIRGWEKYIPEEDDDF